ncbi:MAG: hypothetical protein ACYTEQ_20625 [Planctomycetota bacterium]|jgi:hypothetical protein
MAKITFSPHEAISLLISNKFLPEMITDIKADRDTVSFKVATGLPLTDSLPVSIKYLRFKKGILTLQATIAFLKGKTLDTVVSLVAAKLACDYPDTIQLDYPKIYVHINKLLAAKNIRALGVQEITFHKGQFAVTTCAV